MWLLDTKAYRLYHFIDSDIPSYAILSHRWGEQEVSFAQLRDCQMVEDGLSETLEEEQIFPVLSELRAHRTAKLKNKKGWKKIESLCEISRAYRLDWAWIDTVCIDKSSSAELQEAINSMFKWYKNAEKCFVYMNDVESGGDWVTTKPQFHASCWFKRGWTLQELLAPDFRSTVFLDCYWNHIGLDEDLVDDISEITGIPLRILTESGSIRHETILIYSVAERMSWAASRQVTRGEDTAYSLLGLFDVNMPLLYGEGKARAFERLQLEILRERTDQSILAWHDCAGLELEIANNRGFDVLARSPLNFAGTNALYGDLAYRGEIDGSGIQVTPMGLLVDARLFDRKLLSKLPSALRTAEGWTARFALLLGNFVKRKSSVKARREIFVQLEHLWENEYFRVGNPFCAVLHWHEAAQVSKPQKICIRSDRSLRRIS